MFQYTKSFSYEKNHIRSVPSSDAYLHAKYNLMAQSVFKILGFKEIVFWLIVRAFWTITKELDFSQTYGFHRIIKSNTMHYFQGKKRYMNGLEFWQKPKRTFFLGGGGVGGLTRTISRTLPDQRHRSKITTCGKVGVSL